MLKSQRGCLPVLQLHIINFRKLTIPNLTILHQLDVILQQTMKLVITFLLFLCALLLTGRSNPYGNTNQNSVSLSSVQLGKIINQSNPGHIKNAQTGISKTTTSNDKSEGVNATETEDEDELISPRKLLEITNYFVSFFHSQAFDQYNSRFQTGLPFCKHFSYTSSDIYIVQRVIRV